MREFLEDVEQHRDAGYGRAQAHARGEMPKRLYKAVAVAPTGEGFAVTLDGKPTETPGRVRVVVPVSGIATIMAGEWAAQGTHIDPNGMPMVRLINSAVESGEAAIPAFRNEVVKYAANDLMLYRADAPMELVAAQEAVWDAALVKMARHFAIRFQPTIGIVHQPQPAATLSKLADALRDEGVLVLTALVSITGITGSGLLAIGLWHRLFTPDQVWSAAHVDEDFQMRLWGEVEEATAHRARRRIEFDTAVAILELLRAG